MNNGFEILLIVGVIVFQTFSGYIGNKYLGAILPIVFSGIVIYLALAGYLELSLRNILIPVLGVGVLVGIYEGGKDSKKKDWQKQWTQLRRIIKMKKIEDYFYKLYAILMSGVAILFFLFSVYAVIGPLHNQTWKLLSITFFMFLLSITFSLIAYHKLLLVFRRKNDHIVKLFSASAIITFTYLTAFSSYLHFIDHYPDSFKMIIFGVAATSLSIFSFLRNQKKD